MLGMVFTELLEMVEQQWSPAVADALLAEVASSTGGAYTAVGNYPYAELDALVAALARRSGLSRAALLQRFGEHMFGRFLQLYPAMIASRTDCFALLASVDSQIHREVHKLYPAAELPTFTVREHSPQRLILEYHSARPLADLAEGLIRAAMAHFREPLQFQRTDLNSPTGAAGAVFELTRA